VAARRDAPRLDLLLADDEGEGELGELGVPDLRAELVEDASTSTRNPSAESRAPTSFAQPSKRSDTVTTRACTGASQVGNAPA